MKYPHRKSDDSNFQDEDLPVFESLEQPAAKADRGKSDQHVYAPQISPSVSPKGKKEEPTDFSSLRKDIWEAPAPYESSTFTDSLIAFLAPFLIFIMVISLVFYLLDIRYIYTEVMDQNISFAAFFFVLGTVALNRLIARDGSNESLLYIVVFAGTAFLYTMALQAYGAGSLAGSFMAGPGEPFFNACVVAFLWWVTNRLTHECCVDTYAEAGEIGILRGTARNVLSRIQRQEVSKESAQKVDLFSPVDTYDPVDPGAWQKKAETNNPRVPAASSHPKGRHPGISIFLFSIPAMVVFALGERVVQHGGETMIFIGRVYVVCFVAAALMLLMLTSLFQLRAYFRERRVRLPRGLVMFWVILGTVMVLVVLFGAASLPRPPLPTIAYVAHHEYDPWRRGSTFRLTQVMTAPGVRLQQSQIVEVLGQFVLIVLGLFLLYGILRLVGAAAAAIGRNRDRYPAWIVRGFDALDKFLMAIAKVPQWRFEFSRKIRISRELAQSMAFSNPLADPQRSQQMSAADHIAYAYAALCALAADLGVPRRPDQTPYEFIQSFPKQLSFLSEEAVELTHLLVLSNYAAQPMDERVYDRLRKFWLNFERFRKHIVL